MRNFFVSIFYVLSLTLFVAPVWAAEECTQPSCFQPRDKELSAFSELESAANTFPYYTGSGTAALAPLTAFGRSLLAAADSTDLITEFGLSLEIPRVTVATLPVSPGANQVVVVTDALNSGSCLVAGGTNNITCQWNGSTWVVIGGGTPGGSNTQVQFNDAGAFGGDAGMVFNKTTNVLTVSGDVIVGSQSVCLEDGTNCPATAGDDQTATEVPFTPTGSIAATNVQTAIAELDTEKQPLGADLTAIEALSGTGFAVRSALNTWVQRTITGGSGNITCTNGDGVSGNPVCDLGPTAMQTDQSNIVTTGTQDNALATAWIAPSNAGSPTGEGSFNFNTVTKKPQMGNGTTTLVLASEAGNVATANAFADNPAGCTLANGEWTNDIDASGTSACAKVIAAAAAAPLASSCRYPGEVVQDTRTFIAGTQGYTYNCYAAGGSPAPFVAQSDGWTSKTDGINSMSPSGPEAEAIRGANGIRAQVFNKQAANFANQPTNDGVKFISDNAADTTQFVRVCGTTFGGTEYDLTCETKALNGTTPVTTAKTDWNNIVSVDLCSTIACNAAATAAGTVTVREASANATIITLPTKTTRVAYQDLTLLTLSGSVSRSIWVPITNFTVDGVQCQIGPHTINGGPLIDTMRCADNAAGRFDLFIDMRGSRWDGTAVTVTLDGIHSATEAVTWASDWSGQCRSATGTINNTYSSPANVDLSFATIGVRVSNSPVTITPDGGCAADYGIAFKAVIDNTTMSTNAANGDILGATIGYTASGL